MKRRVGRPAREYHLRVRTVRRQPIDFEGLARAALEQAAMDERNGTKLVVHRRRRTRPHTNNRTMEARHDDLE